MIVEFYYKDPDAAEAVGSIIEKEHPDVKPYSKDYWDKCREFRKHLAEIYGGLASGSEDLCITLYTDNPETISVNGSKYRLVT